MTWGVNASTIDAIRTVNWLIKSGIISRVDAPTECAIEAMMKIPCVNDINFKVQCVDSSDVSTIDAIKTVNWLIKSGIISRVDALNQCAIETMMEMPCVNDINFGGPCVDSCDV